VHSEKIVRNAEAGFTLIEVLAAMLILTVGLLGLEALGIGAARMITVADRQSEYTTLASDSLESALHELRRGSVPTQFCLTLARGDRLSRTVTFPNTTTGRVTVRAIPNQQSYSAPTRDFEVASSVFLPISPGTTANGSPCS
jgi:prepilin-type N-terminal cleavage/methylation domain-containing protein